MPNKPPKIVEQEMFTEEEMQGKKKPTTEIPPATEPEKKPPEFKWAPPDENESVWEGIGYRKKT